MQTFFFICFGVGILYIAVAFFIGEALGMFDIDFDLNVNGMISPFKPAVLAAFVTVFGGVGLILIERTIVSIALAAACLAGLAVSFLIYRFVIVRMYRAQNTSAAEKQSFLGKQATVTEYIPQGKYGKITYQMNGNTYSAPAKSEDGSEIKRYEQVEIVQIKKNTYYVRKVRV